MGSPFAAIPPLTRLSADTALVRHSSCWFEIDDERVRPLDTPAKLERAFREAEKTSYLLFYRIQRAS